MSKTLKQNASFLRFLQCASHQQQKLLLQSVTHDQAKALLEIVFNLMHREFPLTAVQRDKLRRYKTTLRRLVNTKTSTKQKIKLLKKSRNAVLLVLTAVTPIIKTL